LRDAVDADRDPVADAEALDLDQPGVAVERERHHDDGLERVALGAAGRADVGFAARDADREVEDALDHVAGDAGAVVPHLDQVLGDRDAHLGAVPVSSAASSALSTSSLTTTWGHISGACPICAVSSRLLAKSRRREVLNVSGRAAWTGRAAPFRPPGSGGPTS
jgi:hypothetical protein